MACQLQQTTLEFFKETGIIEDARRITNPSGFNFLNEQYSTKLKQDFNIESDELLFSMDILERTKLRNNIVYRAVPNEQLFNQIQEKFDIFAEQSRITEPSDLLSIKVPLIEYKGLTAQQLVDMENPLEMKKLQDKLEKDIEEFNNLIKCLW